VLSVESVVKPFVTVRNAAADGPSPRVVGVIMSRGDLDLAIRMRKPPDFFELRLDHLVGDVAEVESKLPRLRAPLIITARHPREGGANGLSTRQRRDLLSRFLRRARYVDVELRSTSALRSILERASRKNVRCIISFHNLKSTPDSRSLRVRARAAKSRGADIFKVVTRTDTPAQLAQLLDFITNRDVAGPAKGGQLLQPKSRAFRSKTNRRSWATQPIAAIGCPADAKRVDLALSVMGVGKLGAISRVLLAYCGSALVYAAIGESHIEGQMSLEQLRAFGIGSNARAS
jgi:3-dehydroquinate dehydratase-1